MFLFTLERWTTIKNVHQMVIVVDGGRATQNEWKFVEGALPMALLEYSVMKQAMRTREPRVKGYRPIYREEACDDKTINRTERTNQVVKEIM